MKDQIQTEVQTKVEPSQTSSGFESNQNQTSDLHQSLLAASEAIKTAARVPVYTAVSIAAACLVSDAAVGKARKALSHVLPAEAVFADRKFTELGKILMQQYFQRGDMSGAVWFNELKAIAGAMPSSVVNTPGSVDPSKFWGGVTEEREAESTALAVRGSSLLDRLRATIDSDDFGSDQAFDAELELHYQHGYEQGLKLVQARFQGRSAAQKDVQRGS